MCVVHSTNVLCESMCVFGVCQSMCVGWCHHLCVVWCVVHVFYVCMCAHVCVVSWYIVCGKYIKKTVWRYGNPHLTVQGGGRVGGDSTSVL